MNRMFRIRSVERRGAKGKARLGLKIGRNKIGLMSEKEFEELLKRIQNKSLKPRSLAEKRNYRRIKRIILIIRNKKKFDQLFQKKDCVLLDAVFPDRKVKWLKPSQRKIEDPILLSKFSFLDDPIGTISHLKQIAVADSRNKQISINFMDPFCFDIGPYIILGLMRQNMAPIVKGGKISAGIADAIEAVDMKSILRIQTLPRENGFKVRPFKLRTRRKSGSSEQDNLPTSTTTEEKTCQDFVETVDEWLSNLSRPMQLTPDAKVELINLLGEILDNAKRHSDIKDRDGQWHIAGLMQVLEAEDKKPVFVCNISIVSLGSTIYDTLQNAPNDLKAEIEKKYINKHSQNCSPEVLWNVAALQDGVSRIDGKGDESPTNGIGFMTAMTAFVNFLFNSSNPNHRPAMSVISGRSCIMVKYPYNEPTGKLGERTLAFNEENSLDLPPNKNHVFDLPIRFPGTLISIRFVLDEQHLLSMIGQPNGCN